MLTQEIKGRKSLKGSENVPLPVNLTGIKDIIKRCQEYYFCLIQYYFKLKFVVEMNGNQA